MERREAWTDGTVRALQKLDTATILRFVAKMAQYNINGCEVDVINDHPKSLFSRGAMTYKIRSKNMKDAVRDGERLRRFELVLTLVIDVIVPSFAWCCRGGLLLSEMQDLEVFFADRSLLWWQLPKQAFPNRVYFHQQPIVFFFRLLPSKVYDWIFFNCREISQRAKTMHTISSVGWA